MNIKLSDNGNNFKFRVAGLIVNDNKFLTCQIMNNGVYCLPGGHSQVGENTIETVKRELEEETGIKTEVVRLRGVFENFFTRKNGANFHELCFVYELKPISIEPGKNKDWNIIEHDEDGDKPLEFKWLDLDNFSEYPVRPVALHQLLATNDFVHLVINNDIVTKPY